jgi:hypothetical protein
MAITAGDTGGSRVDCDADMHHAIRATQVLCCLVGTDSSRATVRNSVHVYCSSCLAVYAVAHCYT